MNIILTGPESNSVQSFYSVLVRQSQIEEVEPNISPLIFNKYGLQDLFNSIDRCYHVNSASKCIREFEKVSRSVLDKTEYELVDNFLKNIVSVEYEGMPFCDRSELNPLQTILFERNRRRAKADKRKPEMGSMYIPVEYARFITSCRDLLDQLIKKRTCHSDKYKLIRMNGTHSMTQSLLKIFSDSKIIYLNHDPRNLYSMFKKSKDPWLGKNPEDFSNWFKQSSRMLWDDSAGGKTTYIISYEEILTDSETSLKKLCNFLEVDCNFMDIDDVKNNLYDSVDWYKKVLTKPELQTLEYHCSDFLNPDKKAKT